MSTTILDAFPALPGPPAIHVHDCAHVTINGKAVYFCGGTYECPRCERAFGWCIGAYDDTPALCDDCAMVIQGEP